MTIKKLEEKQSTILKGLKQQLGDREFNKICSAIEIEHHITKQRYAK
jgi:hypothetical protein